MWFVRYLKKMADVYGTDPVAMLTHFFCIAIILLVIIFAFLIFSFPFGLNQNGCHF
ncbi:hypothetical protein BCL90_5237 [Pedobacter alluvionis]|uniref:Uncharacterized protein n=1 Tax=Pedobacter alluvionis TaxID=475253 RepID=A0A497XL16_9SPHI|nr:hypothetical protein BCL90_5237 [Pedobacter alluvionis]